MSTDAQSRIPAGVDLSQSTRARAAEDAPFAVDLGRRPGQTGKIWGICQCGGGGTPNARGLNLHRWVEQYGWQGFFQRTISAVKEMQITAGVSIHNIMGNQAGVNMFLDDPLLAIPSRTTREQAYEEIKKGFEAFAKQVGYSAAYYCGGLYLPLWTSLTDAQMADRAHACLSFVPEGSLIIIDGGASSDSALAETTMRLASILMEDGYRVGPEPIPVMDSVWRNSADTTLILGKQVLDIEEGRSWALKEGKKVRIDYAPFDEINGELVVAMIESGYLLGDVVAMMRRGVHVGINAFGGGWTPPNMKVKLKAPDIEALASRSAS